MTFLAFLKGFYAHFSVLVSIGVARRPFGCCLSLYFECEMPTLKGCASTLQSDEDVSPSVRVTGFQGDSSTDFMGPSDPEMQRFHNTEVR